MAKKHKPEESLRAALAALQRVSDAFARRRAQLARGAGLTEAQWRVLEEIAAEDFMPSLFARRQEQTPAAVSKVIRQLLDLKLVEVSISPGDARQRRYALSGKGRQTMEIVRQDRQRALDRVWSGLDARALDSFAAFAGGLAERMEEHERGEARRKSEMQGQKKTRRSGFVVEN
jgi:DNA-binding MarR family transcriptional regulator